MILKYKNLGKALKAAFPEIEWRMEKFSEKGKKSMQRWYEGKMEKKDEGGREWSCITRRYKKILEEGGRRKEEGGRKKEEGERRKEKAERRKEKGERESGAKRRGGCKRS
jgi:hypothetical protein